MQTEEFNMWRGFGSDNHATVHPAVLEAIDSANVGHAHGYGDDPWTQRATELLAAEFGGGVQVAFVFNGTGANVVGLASNARRWESVICPETAHLNTDECAAPERLGGLKLVPVATPDGKLTPELVEPHLTGFGFEHAAQPRVISISQVSELGTVYTPDEIRALSDLAHAHGMIVHMDGARIANAAVSLGCSMKEMCTDPGVDLLSFGGTKNGMLFGEAVVLFGDAITDDLRFVRKQMGQLASKMRFVSAQFIAMIEDGLYLRCAAHANTMAARLADGLRAKGVEIAYSVDANEVFVVLPKTRIGELQKQFHFYTWDTHRDLVRLVTSWDTEAAEVDALIAAV
jgi:threonine aldolase